MSMIDNAVNCRSMLFLNALDVKGMSDIDMAFASGTDAVCVDLEDAVPSHDKDKARQGLFAAVVGYRPPTGKVFSVRINCLGNRDGWADVQRLFKQDSPFNAVVVPKVNHAAEIDLIGRALDEAEQDVSIFAIIETPSGLENAVCIGQGHPRMAALLFGGHDMANALGAEMAWESLLYARSRVVHAAAASQLQAIDCPFQNLSDTDGLIESCRQSRSLGMTGKTTKHASQVATIQSSFTPSKQETAFAEEILELYDKNPGSPLIYEGQLIELPMIKRLRRIAAASM